MAPKQRATVSVIIVIGVSIILLLMRGASDLHSPYLFLLKAGVFYLSLTVLAATTLLTIWKRTWAFNIGLILVLLMNGPFLLPKFAFKNGATAKNTSLASKQLSVATFSAMTRTQNTDDILGFIENRKPEVLCIQEISEQDRKILLGELNGFYRYWQQNNNNQLTLSNYPLSTWRDAGSYHAMVLAHPNGDIQLVNVHMPRPYEAQGISKTWQEFLALIENKNHTILCGDFNMTPDNTLYDVLTQHLSFEDALTQGYGFTFPNSQRRSALLGPLLRIDYLFARHLQSSKTETIDISRLSDHRAILSHFHIQGDTR